MVNNTRPGVEGCKIACQCNRSHACVHSTRLRRCRCHAQVPWEDLRYIFGEIMYGGHIVEDWDRRLASAYLLKYFQDSLSDGLTLFPGFATPPTNLSYVQVHA